MWGHCEDTKQTATTCQQPDSLIPGGELGRITHDVMCLPHPKVLGLGWLQGRAHHGTASALCLCCQGNMKLDKA